MTTFTAQEQAVAIGAGTLISIFWFAQVEQLWVFVPIVFLVTIFSIADRPDGD